MIVVSKKGGSEMEAENLAILRKEIFSRVRSILFERYGESIPTSLIENEPRNENAVKTIRRVESFRADEDLLDLFEALEKVFSGSYGRCLFCRKEIEFSKLRRNPLAKFCDNCERILNPSFSAGSTEVDNR